MSATEAKWASMFVAVIVALVMFARFGIAPTVLLLIASFMTYIFGTVDSWGNDE